MISVRAILWACLSLPLGACVGSESGVTAEPFPGRLTVRRTDGGVLFTAPARATTCARDTSIALAGVGDLWAGALSVGTAWPRSTADQFHIRTTRDTAGTAMMALRALGSGNDSSWTAVEGTVRLDGGTADLKGSFEATLVRGAVDTMRVRGTFSGPEPAQACP